jgi:hypothetical protein
MAITHRQVSPFLFNGLKRVLSPCILPRHVIPAPTLHRAAQHDAPRPATTRRGCGRAVPLPAALGATLVA